MEMVQDFPGGPGVKALHFHRGGHGFHPWLETKTPLPHMLMQQKKRKWFTQEHAAKGIHRSSHSAFSRYLLFPRTDFGTTLKSSCNPLPREQWLCELSTDRERAAWLADDS